MADVNEQEHDSLMSTLTLKSKAGDKKVCKKKYLSWLLGVDRKNLSLEITVWHHSAQPRDTKQ